MCSGGTRGAPGRVLSVRDIVAYLQCPIKLWYRILGIRIADTEDTIAGKVLHQLRIEAAELNRRGELNEARLKARAIELAVSRGISPARILPHLPRILALERSRPPPAILEADVEVHSEALGLRGVIDMIEDGIPIEIKSHGSPRPEDRVQLALYAILLEERDARRIEYGYLELIASAKRARVRIDDRLRGLALDALRRAKESILLLPEVPPRLESCSHCEYRLVCAFRLQPGTA